MTEIPQQALRLIDGPEFATLATIDSDGQPQLSVVWVAREGGDVLISTVQGRQKHRNLVANPRVSLLIYPRENPYEYLEIRGIASMSELGGRELIDVLNRKYTGGDRYTMDDDTDNVRVVVRVTPQRVIYQAA
jgi:PPOX class probable F420-dependent enzyme